MSCSSLVAMRYAKLKYTTIVYFNITCIPRKMVHAFIMLSAVRGYHEYKDVWSAPIDGTELSCEENRVTQEIHQP